MAWGKEPDKLIMGTLSAEYLEIIGIEPNQVGGKIMIDAGVAGKYFRIIVDKNNKEHKFKTMIEAMNFFHQNGYELVSAYGSESLSTQSNYVIRKKAY